MSAMLLLHRNLTFASREYIEISLCFCTKLPLKILRCVTIYNRGGKCGESAASPAVYYFTQACASLSLLQAWLSIPSKMLPIRSHLSKKAPPFRFLTSLTLVTNRVSLLPGSMVGIYIPIEKEPVPHGTGSFF